MLTNGKRRNHDEYSIRNRRRHGDAVRDARSVKNRRQQVVVGSHGVSKGRGLDTIECVLWVVQARQRDAVNGAGGLGHRGKDIGGLRGQLIRGEERIVVGRTARVVVDDGERREEQGFAFGTVMLRVSWFEM